MRLSLLLLVLLPAVSYAQGIFAPENTVFGVYNDGTNIHVTGSGTVAINVSPASEGADNAIDGLAQKYLNFAKINTGLMVSPFGGASIATSLQLWTANDVPSRDPASYAVYGTNLALNGAGMLLSNFTLISEGALALPEGRNVLALDPFNSQTVAFTNSTAFQNYLILFPTIKNGAGSNSMQIGEVQLFGSSASVPDAGPGMISSGLLLIGLCAYHGRRSRRTGTSVIV